MPEDASRLTGGCLCGAVSIEITGPAHVTANCHCLSCQKLSGTGHAFHLMFAEDTVAINGETKGYSWTADSGNEVTTHFCPNCGAPLFGRSSGYPGSITVRAAALDDSSGFSPQVSVYAKRLQNWDATAEGTPAFPEMPPAG